MEKIKKCVDCGRKLKIRKSTNDYERDQSLTHLLGCIRCFGTVPGRNSLKNAIIEWNDWMGKRKRKQPAVPQGVEVK